MQQERPRAGWWTYETRSQPIQAHGHVVTPIGRVAQVVWPGGGLIWHRPLAVEVRQGAQTSRLPIRNTTRPAIALPLIGLAISAVLLAWAQAKRMPRREQRRRSRERL